MKGMRQLNKLTVISEIDDLLDTYCDGCFIKRELKSNTGKTLAHRFCIGGCTVGDQLQFLGRELNKVKTNNEVT